MLFSQKLLTVPALALALAGDVLALAAFDVRPARADALLLVELDSGKVIHSENATHPWYPASVTKLMTTYVTLKAVRDHRIGLDTLFTLSPNAVAQQPSKMGFKAGTRVTVDNALKMLLVHSANDMAVVLAEGVSGSIEKFSDEMNAAAQRLGMTQTNYVNPNGLPADEQVTSARDLAVLARALIREFPEYDHYWHIASIRLGKRIYRNTNKLIDAYPGTDGMKTGFICASGFNLVATATRGDKRLIAVVLGAKSSTGRAVKAAQLFERGFGTAPLGWLMPSLGTVDALVPVAATPPDLREDICSSNRRHHPTEDGDDAGEVGAVPTGGTDDLGEHHALSLPSLRGAMPHGTAVLSSGLAAAIAPVEVYTGPARNGVRPLPATAAPVAKNKPELITVATKPPNPKPSNPKSLNTKPATGALTTVTTTAPPPAAKPVPVGKPAPSAAAAPAKPAVAASGLRPWPGTEKATPAASSSKAKPTVADSPKSPLQIAPKTETQ